MYLKKAISSVLEQSMRVNEIIITDDGSTDGSREIIRSFANQYSILRPIFREKNLGVAANRDLAVRVATSHLITTLDGDDYYFPNKIENEYLALEAGGDVAFSNAV